MYKSLRRTMKHAVVAVTAGAFLISTFIFPITASVALEGGTSGSTPPPDPTSLTATLTTSTPKVTLNWTQPDPGETGNPPTRYVIYRITGSSPNFSGASPFVYTSNTSTTYDDFAVATGTTYNYKVAGQTITIDGFGFPHTSESSNSNLATVTIPDDISPPSPTPTSTPTSTPPTPTSTPTSTPSPTPTPTSTPTINPAPLISAVLDTPQTTALVFWTPLANTTGYFAYRKTPGSSSFTFFGLFSSSTSQFSDAGLTPNSGTYTYKIIATFATGTPLTTESNEASVTPQVIPPSGSPTPFLFITATAKSSTQIDVTWPFVPDTIYYTVYGGLSPTSLSKIGSGAPGSVQISYEDKNLTPNTTYYYKVEAYGTYGLLATSNIANATTLPESASFPNSPPLVDECGFNDRFSPVRITDPNSGVKFTQLPGRAIFKPGETPTFTYCFKNTLSHQVQLKVRRSFVNNKTLKEYGSTIGNVTLEPTGDTRKADRFSFARDQYLDKTLPLGEYRVRVQIIDETKTAVGDEKLPIALNQVDENSFIFLIDNAQPQPPADTPIDKLPPSILKPSDPGSNIKFTQMPPKNGYWAGQGLKVTFTYKNTTKTNQNLTLQCSLLDAEGNLIDLQEANLPKLKPRQSIKLTTGKGCILPGLQPLSLLLPTGYYTFRVQLFDRTTEELVDSNSFNFRVVKRTK